MRPRSSITRLTLILLIVILLPALFFSAYQISTLSESERLVSDMYRRQLESVLFSVNQYALDVANSWVSSIVQTTLQNPALTKEYERAQLRDWCAHTPSAVAVILTDSTLRRVTIESRPDDQSRLVTEEQVLSSLRANRDKIQPLQEYRRAGYRKLQPFELTSGGKPTGAIVLVFAIGQDPSVRVGGLIIDESVFIREILGRKLQDVAGEEFVLGVLHDGDAGLVVSTSTIRPEELKQQKQIWLLPGYSLGIRMKGTTIEELVGARVTKNIGLVILLDLLLVVGIAVLYRNVRREMELVRIKSDFVSNVSHELRTPLALIRLYAETLEMGRLMDEGKKSEYLATILRESERLTRLVNNILDFSRMQSGKKQYKFELLQVNDIIRRVLQTYSVHLQSKGFNPVVELETGLPVIQADEEALFEAVINIIDNAIKYSDTEHYLAVRSRKSGSGVCVDVEDHGVGIAPSDQGKIFDLFYRVPSIGGHDRKGTGIGLSLVKHIMNAHQGTVSVTSTPGKGSTFRLEFPASQA